MGDPCVRIMGQLIPVQNFSIVLLAQAPAKEGAGEGEGEGEGVGAGEEGWTPPRARSSNVLNHGGASLARRGPVRC